MSINKRARLQKPDKQHLWAGRPKSQRQKRRKGGDLSLFQPPNCKTLLGGSAGPGEREKERKRRAAEAILLSPLNLSPSLFPSSSLLTPSSSSSLPARRIVLLSLTRHANARTRRVRLLSQTQPAADCLTCTHAHVHTGRKHARTEIHTHFLESFPAPKTKYRSLVSLRCE